MPNLDYIQNPNQVARAHDYHNRALAMFDAGFTSEAARKDALDYLNRAYEILVDGAINDQLLSQRTRDDANNRWAWDNTVAQKLYQDHNVPALHVWSQKHNDLYAAFPSAVKIANVLAADRNAIKILPLKQKPKSRTRVLQEARSAVAKTCQICSRPILAERGNIAHHGYQRPGDGYQTNSCFGALHLPFEVSRDRLGVYIVMLKNHLVGIQAHRANVAAEKVELTVCYGTGKYDGKGREVKGNFKSSRVSYPISREEHAKLARWPQDLPKTFDEIKARELKRLDRDIHEQELYLVGQEIRYNDWKPAVAVAS